MQQNRIPITLGSKAASEVGSCVNKGNEMAFGLDRLMFFLKRLRERLWVKPLVICLFSVAGAVAAGIADGTGLRDFVPEISTNSIETMLSIMASSMLVIATLAVTSMVAAYASASNTVTPRSIKLVIADDVSQNALSTFIGAFIFSIVALIAVKNNFYETAGRFTLFALTVCVFVVVVFTFVRWVDRIARLGRMGPTIDKVEDVTTKALLLRRKNPTLCGAPASQLMQRGQPVFAPGVGYVQHIDVKSLQAFAKKTGCRVLIAALPGTFVAPGQPLAYIYDEQTQIDNAQAIKAFIVGGDRVFDDDPRFGLVVLSEIAGRALSPAVNDPGTAIDIVGTLVRIFTLWSRFEEDAESPPPFYDRVAVPEISAQDMFDDAFTAIARDGAGTIEVAIRLLKALHSLTLLGDAKVKEAAMHHARMALARCEKALQLAEEIAAVRACASFATVTPDPAC